MAYTTAGKIIQKMTTPVKLDSSAAIISGTAIGAGTSFVIDEDDGDYTKIPVDNVAQSDIKDKISLLEFGRMYRIGGIPILDLVVVYIILYILNAVYFHYDYKFILILTIPVTIVFEIITNRDLKPSPLLTIVFVLSIYFAYQMQ